MEKDPIEDIIKKHYKNEITLNNFNDVRRDFYSLIEHGFVKSKEYNPLALELYIPFSNLDKKAKTNKEIKRETINLFWTEFKVVWGALMISKWDLEKIAEESQEILEEDIGITRTKEGNIYWAIRLKDTKYSKGTEDIVNLARTNPTGTSEDTIKEEIKKIIEYTQYVETN